MYIILDIKPAVPLVVGTANDAKGAASLASVYVENMQNQAKLSLAHGHGAPSEHEMWRDDGDVPVVEVRKKK